MSDFGHMHIVVGRKPHRCEWCYEAILKGEQHHQFKGMWQGDWQNWRIHNECHEEYAKEPEHMDGFMPGEGKRPKLLAGGVK